MSIISKQEMRELAGGKIFSIEFIKKDGSLRPMLCRFGVTKDVTGRGKDNLENYDNLMKVYDISKKAYRTINLKTITKISINGFRWSK